MPSDINSQGLANRQVASSRYEQEEYGAQDNRLSPAKVALGVGLGAVVLGGLAYSGVLKEPLSRTARFVSRMNSNSARAALDGFSRWASGSSGPRSLVEGFFDSPNKTMPKWEEAAKDLYKEIKKSKERIDEKFNRPLHGKRSSFEQKLESFINKRHRLRDIQENITQRNIMRDLIMVGDYKNKELYADAIESVSPLGFIEMNRDKFHYAMRQKLGESYDQTIADKIWDDVGVDLSSRKLNSSDFNTRFITNAERQRLKQLRKDKVTGAERDRLEALQKNQLAYLKSYRRNEKMLREEFKNTFKVNMPLDTLTKRSAGMRQATVEDLLEKGLLGDIEIRDFGGKSQTQSVEEILSTFSRKEQEALRKLSAGSGLYIGQDNDLIDLRNVRASYKGVMDFLYNDLKIPVLNISPLHPFKLFTRSYQYDISDFTFVMEGTIAPTITGSSELGQSQLKSSYMMFNKKLYDIESGEILKNKYGNEIKVDRLATSSSLHANMIAKMIGATARMDEDPTTLVGKVLKFLDLGRQEAPSVLDKYKSILTKYGDPTWDGNAFAMLQNMMANGSTDPALLTVADKTARAMDRFTTALDANLFEELLSNAGKSGLLSDYGIDLSSDEATMRSLGNILTAANEGKIKLSKKYSRQLYYMWDMYTMDGQTFLNDTRFVSTRSPFSFFDEVTKTNRVDGVKKLIQKELIYQATDGTHTNIDLFGFIQERMESGSLSKSNAKEAMRTAAAYVMDPQTILDIEYASGSLTQAAEDLSSLLASMPSGFKEAIAEIQKTRTPWHQFGRGNIPERNLLFNQSSAGRDVDLFGGKVTLIERARGIPLEDFDEAILDPTNKEKWQHAFGSLGGFFKQFVAGRNSLDDVTNATFGPYLLAERLSNALDNAGLGLSNESMGSAGSIMAGLYLKRWLPLYAGLALGGGGVLGYLNWQIGEIFGIRPNEVVAEAIKQLDLGGAIIRDALGITDFAKDMADLTVGSDLLAELPIIGFFNPAESYEELKEEYDSGYTAVRKGRWWALGNTPIQGGRIMYYQPHWYRRAHADIMHTDVMYGSGYEHYSRTPFPTLVNPLAPLKYLSEPYHYEEKHYYDRPYPVTGGLSDLEDIPIIGSALNATVGRIIKPTRYMHVEEMKAIREFEKLQESGTTGDINTVTIYKNDNISDIDMSNAVYRTQKQPVYAEFTSGGRMNLVEWRDQSGSPTPYQPTTEEIMKTYSRKKRIAKAKRDALKPGYVYEEESTHLSRAFNRIKVRVSSFFRKRSLDDKLQGKLQQHRPNQYTVEYVVKDSIGTKEGAVVTASDNASEESKIEIAKLNEGIKRAAKEKKYNIKDTTLPPHRNTDLFSKENPIEDKDIMETTDAKYVFGKTYYGITEMTGIYGYAATVLFGEPYAEEEVLQSSSRMTSAERQFWDLELGGIGGDVSEIGRRFIPHRQRSQSEYNPIRNTMPDWMPGDNYFIDFKHGDPYIKVQKGEMRLPGSGYELINKVRGRELYINAAHIGKKRSEIEDILINKNAPMTELEQYTYERGEQFKSYYRNIWRQRKLANPDNINISFYDKKHKISGTIDAIVDDYDGPAIAQVKAVSSAEFDKLKLGLRTRTSKEATREANLYMHSTKIKKSVIMYVDEDDPTRELGKEITYSRIRAMNDLIKLKATRKKINKKIKSGEINPFDLYGDLDRFKILADVAPYSEEFRYYKDKLESDPTLTPFEKKEFRDWKKRASNVKKKHRFYNYKFDDTAIDNKLVMVKEVLNNNSFTVYGDNRIYKLAGINVPSGADDERAQAAAEILGDVLKKKKLVRIAINADELDEENQDTYQTVNAIVYSEFGKNINKELLELGLAKERKSDKTATGLTTRYNSGQLIYAKLWEKFAHLDTPFHTKFLQVRSPLEDFKRREVYGKNFQSWQHPIKDYLVPTMESFMSHGPVWGFALGAVLGQAFVRRKESKLVAALMVGSIAAVGGLIADARHEPDKAWIPRRREKEREIEEYFDVLKYIKARGIYREAIRRAKRDGIRDPERKIKKIEERARRRRKKLERLEERKKRLYIKKELEPDRNREKIEKLEARLETARDPKVRRNLERRIEQVRVNRRYRNKFSKVSKDILDIKEEKDLYKLSKWEIIAYQALMESKQTLYGGDPFGDQRDFEAALPNKYREYAREFLKTKDAKERKEILSLVPENQKRYYQARWGMKVDKKPDLEDFFKDRYLPDANWEGWRPEKDLEDVMIKVIQRGRLDPAEFGIWKDDIKRAEENNAPALDFKNYKRNPDDIEKELRMLLGGAGLGNIDIVITPNENDEIRIELEMQRDRTKEFEEFTRNNIEYIL